ITAPTADLPAGVFVMGSVLQAGGTLDDIAVRVPGLALSSFDDLLVALDAAGARAGARMPLVIDGLNEAERPTDWRTLLEQVAPALPQFQHVLLVATLRTDSTNDVLPADVTPWTVRWEEPEVERLVRRYLDHYLTEPVLARLPCDSFTDARFRRIFRDASRVSRSMQ